MESLYQRLCEKLADIEKQLEDDTLSPKDRESLTVEKDDIEDMLQDIQWYDDDDDDDSDEMDTREDCSTCQGCVYCENAPGYDGDEA
jgi:hypothetical protein